MNSKNEKAPAQTNETENDKVLDGEVTVENMSKQPPIEPQLDEAHKMVQF